MADTVELSIYLLDNRYVHEFTLDGKMYTYESAVPAAYGARIISREKVVITVIDVEVECIGIIGELNIDAKLISKLYLAVTYEPYTKNELYNGMKGVVHYFRGKVHRDGDLPAKEWADGTKSWWINGERHRDGDKPAWIGPNSCEEWHFNGQLHRGGDLPARVYNNGDKHYYVNGVQHRDGDRPAIEWANGAKEWYKNGVSYVPKPIRTTTITLEEGVENVTCAIVGNVVTLSYQ